MRISSVKARQQAYHVHATQSRHGEALTFQNRRGLLSVTAIAPDHVQKRRAVQAVAKEKAQTPMMSGKHHVKRSMTHTKASNVTWASDGQAART